jgi:hypothetical protein
MSTYPLPGQNRFSPMSSLISQRTAMKKSGTIAGDWGEVDDHDRRENELSLAARLVCCPA